MPPSEGPFVYRVGNVGKLENSSSRPDGVSDSRSLYDSGTMLWRVLPSCSWIVGKLESGPRGSPEAPSVQVIRYPTAVGNDDYGIDLASTARVVAVLRRSLLGSEPDLDIAFQLMNVAHCLVNEAERRTQRCEISIPGLLQRLADKPVIDTRNNDEFVRHSRGF